MAVPDPLSFDFITDEDLRASLISDHHELQTCLEGGAWKAAHVMSGSIVEAVLVDYLLGIQYARKDPLKMTMADLIAAGLAAGVLSDKTSDLSSVIRGYRNLIHPGRLIRLGESADEEGAMPRLARLYHEAYTSAPEPVQRKVAKSYVTVLKEEVGWRVTTHDEQFFRGYFLDHLSENERKLVKAHFFSRTAEGTMSRSLVDAVEGLSAHLKPNEITKFFDPIIRTISYAKGTDLGKAAVAQFESEYRNYLPQAQEQRVLLRLEGWIDFHMKADRPTPAERLRDLWLRLGGEDDDIPF